MNFLKSHSFGNDFIILNDPKLRTKKNLKNLAKKLCDRHLGIGADGILVVLPSKHADVRMRIINADGSEASMCGNGVRCLARHLFESKFTRQKKITIETLAGIITVESNYQVAMGEPIIKKNKVNFSVKIFNKKYQLTNVFMGNPHAIIFTSKLDQTLLAKIGPIIENHPYFLHKTNVNLVVIKKPNKIKILTWEKGVGLSRACGTGACAAVVAGVINNLTARKVRVELGEGNLVVEWHKNNMVDMTGPAPINICEGKILL